MWWGIFFLYSGIWGKIWHLNRPLGTVWGRGRGRALWFSWRLLGSCTVARREEHTHADASHVAFFDPGCARLPKLLAWAWVYHVIVFVPKRRPSNYLSGKAPSRHLQYSPRPTPRRRREHLDLSMAWSSVCKIKFQRTDAVRPSFSKVGSQFKVRKTWLDYFLPSRIPVHSIPSDSSVALCLEKLSICSAWHHDHTLIIWYTPTSLTSYNAVDVPGEQRPSIYR
jgi:hypothetical protein